MENLSYLVAVYTIVWAALFGYLGFFHYRHKKLQKDIDSLKKEPKDDQASEAGLRSGRG